MPQSKLRNGATTIELYVTEDRVLTKAAEIFSFVERNAKSPSKLLDKAQAAGNALSEFKLELLESHYKPPVQKKLPGADEGGGGSADVGHGSGSAGGQ